MMSSYYPTDALNYREALRQILNKGLSGPEVAPHGANENSNVNGVLDGLLGFLIESCEGQVLPQGDAELWKERGARVFQTPYLELREMLGELALTPESTIVDLGAAYGRLGIVIHAWFPELRFIGYEISPVRVNEAKRVYALHGLDPDQMREADLASADFTPALADAYFLYDYGNEQAVAKTLDDLKQIAASRPGFRVVGRGRRSRDLIERGHPWLSQVHPPRHCGNYSIYQS